MAEMADLLSPPELMPRGSMRYRVAGTEDPEWFHRSGGFNCEIYEAALSSIGRSLGEFRNVLDFGCGVGRVLRWLQALLPDARLAGTDSDHAAIAWIREHYPAVESEAIGGEGLPPLHFEDGRFDLVLAYSVFTHLNAHYQDAWLAELQRVVCPGGILLLSISGPRMIDKTLTTSDHPNLADLRKHLDEFTADGILHWLNDGWEQHFPAYYHTTFHSHQYVRDHWSRWFEVLGIHADAALRLKQDIVILRRK
jgi:SAM-dependent methyltransferase